MGSTTIQVTNSATIGLYEPPRSMSVWRDASKGIMQSSPDASSSMQPEARPDSQDNAFDYEYGSHDAIEQHISAEDAVRLSEKVKRRLAQNREAARKSRMRKKVYVEQLESSRVKLAQLELQIQQTKQQVLYAGASMQTNQGFAGNGNMNASYQGLPSFEIEYGHWVEEQTGHNGELRNALQANIPDAELKILVEGSLNHYYSLFRMKAEAAKSDVFYLMSGMWRASVERFFHWIGGFRPSDFLNFLVPQLDPVSSQQMEEIGKLQYSSRQAEDALSRGMDKLQQTVMQIMFNEVLGMEKYAFQMTSALEKLEAIEGFVNQADHLREQTLQLMYRILTPRQSARGLLALGDYFHRLRALSSLWTARPRDPC